MPNKIISIIPARGGSKRLPGKNIMILGNKPIIQYSIDSSLSSCLIQRTIVSTDSEEIAEVSRHFKAEVIMRPHDLATDTSMTIDALRHVINYLKEKEGFLPDMVITLQPTCPFRPQGFIDNAIKGFISSEADSLVSVSEVRLKLGYIENDFFIPMYKEGLRKQDLESRYRENGVIYITRCSIIIEKNSIFGEKIYPLIMDNYVNTVNIDSKIDFDIAQFFLDKYFKKGVVL